jgi:hypothetical protein
VTIAVITASTIAPPTWNDVCTSPDATPCSFLFAMPDVAWMLSIGKHSAKPIPIRSIVGRKTEA